MLKWLGPRKAKECEREEVTEDPLATIATCENGQKIIYSVSRTNPIFTDPAKHSPETIAKPPKTVELHPRQKSVSSGYGGSNEEASSNYTGQTPPPPNDCVVLIRNPHYVRSISTVSVSSKTTGIPKPIWPKYLEGSDSEDSLVDETLLFYTDAASCVTQNVQNGQRVEDVLSLGEVLLELAGCANATGEGKTEEEVLREVREKISASLEALRYCTEHEIRRLCVNLARSRMVKAFSSNYSSSSSFSDVADLRNATICGDLLSRGGESPKRSLLRVPDDSKPSVWQQYYGVNLTAKGQVKCIAKSTDVPIYPGGRPEADFTLDLPRSELLTKRMEAQKRWRCRCRLLTSFLGLIFFLLSVMAVSLVLTRGKRMFGSMA